MKFSSYQSAIGASTDAGGLGPVSADGRTPLQQAVYDVMAEGSIYDSATQELGVDFVYVINVRSEGSCSECITRFN